MTAAMSPGGQLPVPVPQARGADDIAGVRAAVDAALAQFLADKQVRHSDQEVVMFIELLRDFLTGGKRLRPLLCCCGWRLASAGADFPPEVVTVAASLELFHTFAIVQDDVMDDSDTRRGRLTVHRLLAARHADHPRSAWLGANMAIMLGDLTLGWSYELAQTAALDAGQSARLWPALDVMRARTLSGQYRDLLATGGARRSIEQALAIAQLKTAAYTVESPLRVGALLAGASQQLLSSCSAYSGAVGEAFQLRDDLLGVFGDPARTGKPVLDDLRDGKPTVLLAIARQRASQRQLDRLDALAGDPSLDHDGAAEAREILTATGARAAVERMITERCQRAISVLSASGAPSDAVAMLCQLTTSVLE